MNYNNEVENRWGNTSIYKEYLEKHDNNHDLKAKQLMNILKEIGDNKHLSFDNLVVQELVKKLQDFISNNFYTCNNEILYHLGSMYVNDLRFKNNIDNTCGNGTSEFVFEAIKYYCK